MNADNTEMLNNLRELMADEEFCRDMREMFASDEIRSAIKVGAVCLSGVFIIDCMTTIKHL